jgi:hypothetical protein
MHAWLQIASNMIQSARQDYLPRRSDWVLDKVGEAALSVDLADGATLGAAALVPLNVDAKGGGFVARLRGPGETVRVIGVGAGLGIGLGWQMPFVSAEASGGRVAASILNSGIGELGKAIASPDLPGGGIGQLWTGPSALGILTPRDFSSHAAVAKLEANFGPNGIAGGLIFFASRPLVTITDLAHVTAFGFMGSIEISALKVTVESGLMNYRITDTKTELNNRYMPSAAQVIAARTA